MEFIGSEQIFDQSTQVPKQTHYILLYVHTIIPRIRIDQVMTIYHDEMHILSEIDMTKAFYIVQKERPMKEDSPASLALSCTHPHNNQYVQNPFSLNHDKVQEFLHNEPQFQSPCNHM